jgi:hypothetical protein
MEKEGEENKGKEQKQMEAEEEKNFLLKKNCTMSLSLEVIRTVKISITVLWV